MKTKQKKQSPSKLIRKDDKVMAITGNDKGQIGTVLSVDGDKVVVQGLNIKKKHVKPNQQMQQGGILEIEKPLHVSNLRVCVDDKPVKLKTRLKDGKKELIYKDDKGKEIVYRKLSKG